MRTLLIVLALGACVDGGEPTTDAAPRANNLEVTIGERCDAEIGLICGNGTLGACVDETCTPQCSAVSYPRCAAGHAARNVPLDENTMVCVCD